MKGIWPVETCANYLKGSLSEHRHQQGHVGSKALLHLYPPVFNWMYQLTQWLHNGCCLFCYGQIEQNQGSKRLIQVHLENSHLTLHMHQTEILMTMLSLNSIHYTCVTAYYYYYYYYYTTSV